MNKHWFELLMNDKITYEQFIKIEGDFSDAMAVCQGEIQTIGKDCSVSYASWKFASWAKIREETCPILAKNGLACTQYDTGSIDKLVLITIVRHKSGYFEEYQSPIIGNFENSKLKLEQVVQAAITYWKRNVYNEIFCIGTDEEDSDKNHEPRQDSSFVQKKPAIQTKLLDEKCPGCGKQLRLLQGQYGPFLGCTGYQDGCRHKQRPVEGS